MPPKASAKVVPNVKSIAQKRKAQEEKLAEAVSPSKRAKKVDSDKAGVALSPSKPITPAKSVINLHDSANKFAPETYINPIARKYFRAAEVHSCLVRHLIAELG